MRVARSPSAIPIPSAGVLLLDGEHGVIDKLADGGLLCIRLQVDPTSLRWNPEDVIFAVLVAILDNITAFGLILHVVLARRIGSEENELIVAFGEGIGDVLQEDEAEHDVFVLGGVHVAAQLVRCGPQGLLESQAGAVVFAAVGYIFGFTWGHALLFG